jgi:hypothetical protein
MPEVATSICQSLLSINILRRFFLITPSSGVALLGNKDKPLLSRKK